MHNQMEDYQQQIKEIITQHINNNRLAQAKDLIQEYENVVSKDIDIYSMKGIISLLENNLDMAETLFHQGLEVDAEFFDLLYNLAYVYELKNHIGKAYAYYRRAVEGCLDHVLKENLTNKLADLSQQLKREKIKRIVILSSCSWGTMLQRPHQMAKALAALPRVSMVDFIQPPLRCDTNKPVTMEDVIKHSWEQLRHIKTINIHTPFNAYHEDRFLHRNTGNIVQQLIDDSEEEVVILCYLPPHISIINQLNENFKVVYDCVDDHGDLEYSYWSSRYDIELEMQLSDRAEAILTTSTALYLSKALVEGQNNVFLSKNAVNQDDFCKQEVIIPEDLALIPEPRICYVGAVDKWFDEELFYSLVRSNSDKSFVVIGPVRSGILSVPEQNLYVLGVRDHSELNRYLRYMKVGIIPFKDNIDLIVNCDPIKLYEYVASGLPVVASGMPEIITHNRPFIKAARNLGSFHTALNELMNYNLNTADIDNFLSCNSWDQRAEDLMDILEGNTYRLTGRHLSFRNTCEEQIIDNPILQSLYSLTYLSESPSKYLEYAEKAYKNLPIRYCFKNYVYALIINGNLELANTVVVNSSFVSDVYKAELVYITAKKLTNLQKVTLLLAIGYHREAKKEMRYLSGVYTTESKYAVANYCFIIGQTARALERYKDLISQKAEFRRNPLFLMNFSEALKGQGNLYSDRLREIGEKVAYKMPTIFQ